MKKIFLLLLISFFKNQLHASDEDELFVNIKVGDVEYREIPKSLLMSRESLLKSIFNYENYKNKEGFYLIYRSNGNLFKYILQFLEQERITIEQNENTLNLIYDLIYEAEYFCLFDMISYLRVQLNDKKIPYDIWIKLPEDKLEIINIPNKDKYNLYYIFNVNSNKIFYGCPYIKKRYAKKKINLRKGNIVPIGVKCISGNKVSGCSLPVNCINNTVIGSVQETDFEFDPAPLMNHIYGDKMCSRFNEGYGIFDIMTGKKVIPEKTAFSTLDECIKVLLKITNI